MARSRLYLVSLLALVLAVGAAFLARGMAAPKPARVVVAAAAEKPTVQVLIAKRDLAAGDRLSPDAVGWQAWPADGVNAAFVTAGAPQAPAKSEQGKLINTAAAAAKTALMGTDTGPAAALMGAVVRQPILAGEPIVASKVVRAGQSGVLAVTLDPGMRAMSVPLTAESGAGGFILPGDHVDVIQTRKLDAQGGSEAPMAAFTVMKNVRVLAVDQNTQAQKGAQTAVGSTATVEVSPDQAEFLTLARAQGQLNLVLRSYADASGPAAIGEVPHAQHAQAAAAPDVVQVFRNGQATDVKVAR